MGYLIDFTLLVMVYIYIYFRIWKNDSKNTLIIKTLMFVYIVMVFFVTIMPFTIPLNGTNKLFLETANFMPFKDLMLKYHGATKEIFLNILMMMPFGFLYPIIMKKGLLKTVIATLTFSLFIECYQLISVWWNAASTRIFDVTDLITNSTGGLFGYISFSLVTLISKNHNS
ncbi:hypothetical protein CD29_15775 [Ureibacillus manganicus DSM 26584]|uniref:VanZ-like domain-containing protein n=2 Tax=Ureibacillus TaxID=160795 RepID=A0A0A3I3A1_9BACL|nr:hypothetical protein CD29_15775 [Ureibacillus manganicus DSM 26584]